ncbi:hypothetical protein NCLIV_045480 [Neospora caninum Liverpool]|uniref:Uncharacterized protein n=1 Tax=Neospora caninum (strain Liverpool) TaxID=572307 RepID=F0VLI7_NEOCL|nr:hypothetical protein NCLIV_045480 [Neospora caninum Liverpool]CBZ54115.1 hypothetical protein NCLIV_045480 [Neospora caninum Liverpool]CEL68814.1 TPA: hypothetical protein BN1204_045480 [Neospora caninum Liverpool]|eukprot:XP_003884146.1 hypothetical protein NCLIV_045480 [Neospora caninum Liverpool]
MAPATASKDTAASADVQSWRTSTRGIGPRLAATFSWLTLSTATFAFMTTSRRKEWADICLDYCYSKRAFCAPSVYDRLFAFLKKVPK